MSVLFNDALQGKFCLLLMLIEKQDIEKLCSVFENKATLKWTCVVFYQENWRQKRIVRNVFMGNSSVKTLVKGSSICSASKKENFSPKG